MISNRNMKEYDEDMTNDLNDGTKLNQVQTLLEQTQQNYEAFFNSIDDFLFVLDATGNIIHVNNTVTSRLGYSMPELIGQSVLMVHPIERREEAGKIVADMLAGKAQVCPVPIISKEGDQIPVETRITKGSWDGKPALFGVTKDISQIKLSEEKFSKVFYLNPSACGLSDMKNHKYIEVNEAFYKLLGFEKDEVIGKTVMELGILEPKVAEAILSQADKNGKISNVEADLKTKTGEIKHVLMSAENIMVQSDEFRFTVVNDVTELKKVQNELLAKSQETERMNSFMIGREVKMAELKEKIVELEKQLKEKN